MLENPLYSVLKLTDIIFLFYTVYDTRPLFFKTTVCSSLSEEDRNPVLFLSTSTEHRDETSPDLKLFVLNPTFHRLPGGSPPLSHSFPLSLYKILPSVAQLSVRGPLCFPSVVLKTSQDRSREGRRVPWSLQKQRYDVGIRPTSRQ